MLKISPRYVLDEDDRPVAVQLDLTTFKKMTEALENYGLAHCIRQVQHEPSLDLNQAKRAYKRLKKKD